MAASKGAFRVRSPLAAPLLVAAVLVAAHLRVEAAGPDYRGLLLPLKLAFDVGCVGALLVLAWAMGRSILEGVGFSPDTATDRFLFATAIGIGVEGTAVLGLGAASLLHPWTLTGLGFVFVWASRGSWGALPEEVRRVGVELGEGLGRWGILGLALVAAVLLLQSAMPPADWDVLTYHLDIPHDYLSRGEVFLPEDNHHAAFVGLAHMLYVPLLAVGAQSAPAVLSSAVALLLALTMYAVGNRLFDSSTGRLASVLVWGSPAIFLVAVTARVDVTMTWLLVMAHYAVVVRLERRGSTRWWWMGAILIGLAVATKFSALAYLVGLAPVMVWASMIEGDGSTRPILELIGFGAVALLVAAPWLVKNAVLLGSPFYPYLAELRLEPWLAGYLGSHAVPETVSPDVFGIAALTREPFSILALFTNPGSMTPEGEGVYYFGNFALLFLPLAFLASGRRNFALLVPAVLYVVVVLLAADSWVNLRYLIPALVPAALVASCGVAEGAARFFSAGWRRGAWCGLAIVLALLPTVAAAYFKVSWMRPHEHWLGLRSEHEYLEVFPHGRARSRINALLPSESRIVMLFESRGYGFQPEVRQDNLSRNWAILSSRDPWRDCLGPTGATHMLVNYGHLAALLRRGLDVETVNWSSFPRFARACLEREAVMSSAILYRIVSPAESDPTVLGSPGGGREAGRSRTGR